MPLLEHKSQRYNEAQRRAILAWESLSSFREPILVAVLAAGLYAGLSWGELAFSSVLLLAVIFYRVMVKLGDAQSRYQTMVNGESASGRCWARSSWPSRRARRAPGPARRRR